MEIKDKKLWGAYKEYTTKYLPCVRRQSISSVKAGKKAIDLYELYIEETFNISFSKVTAEYFTANNILAFQEWLRQKRNNVVTTINNRVTAVKQFCNYLVKQKLISVSDYAEIQDIKNIPDLRLHELEWLTIEELETVFDNYDKSTALGFRNWFIMKFLYETGCRIQELLNVKVKDIKIHKDGTGTVRLFGKGSKERNTPLQSRFIVQLKKYYALFHRNLNTDEYVFYTIKRDPETHAELHTKMSPDTAEHMLLIYEEELKKNFPEQKHLHCHLFRHTRAMHLYAVAGIDLDIVSDWLGHSCIETTQLYYARATLDMKRKAAEKLEKHFDYVLGDVNFTYENDEEALKKLYGLK